MCVCISMEVFLAILFTSLAWIAGIALFAVKQTSDEMMRNRAERHRR